MYAGAAPQIAARPDAATNSASWQTPCRFHPGRAIWLSLIGTNARVVGIFSVACAEGQVSRLARPSSPPCWCFIPSGAVAGQLTWTVQVGEDDATRVAVAGR